MYTQTNQLQHSYSQVYRQANQLQRSNIQTSQSRGSSNSGTMRGNGAGFLAIMSQFIWSLVVNES